MTAHHQAGRHHLGVERDLAAAAGIDDRTAGGNKDQEEGAQDLRELNVAWRSPEACDRLQEREE